MELKSNDIEQLLKLAERSLTEAKPDAASAYCAQILEGAPEHPNALRILALVKYQAGEVGDALELLERAIRTSPRFAAACHDYGAILLSVNRVEEAIDSLRQAIRLQPRHAEAHVNMGNAMHSLGRMKIAEDHLRLAIEINPRHARGLTSLGNLLRVTNRSEEAITYFQSALELAPRDATIHYFLGNEYRDCGRLEKAIASYKKAVELRPDFEEANLSLGVAAMGRRDFSSAINFLEKANTPLGRPKLLECLLRWERYDDFFSRVESIAQFDCQNLDVAALSAYAAQQLQRRDPYPFCPDPMKYIRIIDDPGGIAVQDKFLQRIIEAVENLESVWVPRGVSTEHGYQTAPTLFNNPTGALAILAKILKAEVAAYRENYVASETAFIQQWPESTVLKGWFVRLVKGGHQAAHNHKTGWLSGVVYLRVPDSATAPEGAIEFGLKKADYPAISEDSPTKIHVPVSGQLALFPSSLCHRTIPFTTDEERLCIAFDISPA